MCVRLISAAWPVQVSPSSKLILVFLADRANPANDDACWPSVAYIVKHTGLSERTVQTHLQLLERAGHITMEPRKGTSTNYIVHPRKDCAPEETAPVQPRPKGGANKAENSRSPRTQNVIHNNNLQPSQFKQKWASFDIQNAPFFNVGDFDETSMKCRKTLKRRPVTILPADFMTKGFD